MNCREATTISGVGVLEECKGRGCRLQKKATTQANAKENVTKSLIWEMR